MNKWIVPILVCWSGLVCHGEEPHVFDETASPDGQIVIVKTAADIGARDYYFVRQSDHQRLGYVLPPRVSHGLRVNGFRASWNAHGTRVAVLMSYATKCSEVLLFSKNADGRYEPVALREPDTDKLYRQRTGQTIPRPGDGYNENAVGPWLDDDTVCLVAGNAVQSKEDPGDYTHLFVTYKARIRGKHASISALQLQGPLSDAEGQQFTARWGERYF